MSASPLFLIWSAIDKEQPNMENAANMINLFGSMAVYNLLNQVTFHEDGNITAKYWDGEFTMAGADDNGVLKASHEDWSVSPKNLAFWYARNEMLYIVPNINAILQQVGEDNEEIDINDPESLNAILEKLNEYNIDINAILPSIMGWMTTGIPVKYTKNGSDLKISVDKQMVEPFMKALLPALEVLQVKLDEILADPTNENSFMIKMVLGMLQIEKLTDIKTIWEQNTAEFDLSLNFVK